MKYNSRTAGTMAQAIRPAGEEGPTVVSRMRIRVVGVLCLGLFLAGAGTVEKPANHLDDTNRLAKAVKNSAERLLEYRRCADRKKSTGCEIFRTNFIQFHNQELLRVPVCLDCHASVLPGRYKVPDPSTPESFLTGIHRDAANCFQCHDPNDLSAEKVNDRGNRLFRIPARTAPAEREIE